MRYARRAAQWAIEQAAPEGFFGAWVTLRVAPDGVVHLAYEGELGNTIRHAWRNDDGWHAESIVTDNVMGVSDIDMVIASSGYLDVAYFTDVLHVATHTEDGWSLEQVDPEARGYATVRCSIRRSGALRWIAYLANLNGPDGLRVGRSGRGGWSLEDTGYAAASAALAVDGRALHVAYATWDGVDGQLMHAWRLRGRDCR